MLVCERPSRSVWGKAVAVSKGVSDVGRLGCCPTSDEGLLLSVEHAAQDVTIVGERHAENAILVRETSARELHSVRRRTRWGGGAVDLSLRGGRPTSDEPVFLAERVRVRGGVTLCARKGAGAAETAPKPVTTAIRSCTSRLCLEGPTLLPLVRRSLCLSTTLPHSS